MEASAPVLYFDGLCNLCNGAVQYVIKNDPAGLMHFASLQSPAGEQAIRQYKEQYGKVPDSLLLSIDDHFYSRSDAALHTAILIGKWRLLSKMFLRIPRFIRDGVYDLIAHNRYKWFGRKQTCMVPAKELQSRFLS